MISHATIIGRNHRLRQHNCQDFALADSSQPGCAYGLVLDGCGGKYRETIFSDERPQTAPYPSHNEVGAKLLGQFTAAWLHSHLIPGSDLDTLINNLYKACATFLKESIALLPTAGVMARNRFIATHLLCTLLGFVVTPTAAAFFWSGDGYLCHNDRVTYLDNENRPDYLAYRLMDDGNGHFDRQILANSQEIGWLAVATDGWQAQQFVELAKPRTNLELQRWLNLQARQCAHCGRAYFEDDGAVAAYYSTINS